MISCPQFHSNAILQKECIRQAFNSAANSYDDYSDIQTQIGMLLIQTLLDFNNNFSSVLDLGCGTGVITKELAKNLQYEEFCAIDIAEQLLKKAQLRLASHKVSCYEADYDAYYQKNHFDLIFSNFSLQWSMDLKKLFQNIYGMLKQNGILGFSIPLQGTFFEISPESRNSFYSIEEINRYLKAAQFSIMYQRTHIFQMSFGSIKEALEYIKKIGAHHVMHRKYPVSLMPYRLVARRKLYQKKYYLTHIPQ